MGKLENTAAAALVSGAITASLVIRLHHLGVLSDQDVQEVYDLALLQLEQQEMVDPASAHVFALARRIIEQHLREIRDG